MIAMKKERELKGKIIRLNIINGLGELFAWCFFSIFLLNIRGDLGTFFFVCFDNS